MSYGIFVNGQRPKSKKAVKEAILADEYVQLENTSLFGNGFDGPVSNAPQGRYDFVGPCPFTNRKFYGNVIVDSTGKVTIK